MPITSVMSSVPSAFTYVESISTRNCRIHCPRLISPLALQDFPTQCCSVKEGHLNMPECIVTHSVFFFFCFWCLMVVGNQSVGVLLPLTGMDRNSCTHWHISPEFDSQTHWTMALTLWEEHMHRCTTWKMLHYTHLGRGLNTSAIYHIFLNLSILQIKV